MQELLSHIRTDLAIESAEGFSEKERPVNGVEVEELVNEESRIKITRVSIHSEQGAKQLHKPQGCYITLEAPGLSDDDEDYHREITDELIRQLEVLEPKIKHKKVLVVGLGNREITPDALGPLVVDHLFITRHLIKEYGVDSKITRGMGSISAIAPGVMAQTGMEGREVIRGVIAETQPDLVVIIDALAARNVQRLNSTIQLTDTGISPGAGVGNHRLGLDRDSLGVPVIAIGIPTVIDAATIVSDTMMNLMNVLEQSEPFKVIYESTKSFDAQEKHLLMRELMAPEMVNMFVTPKDIDHTINKISYTISEAINSLCHSL